MKSNFDKCLAMLLEHEGGFTADKRDKGNAGMAWQPRINMLGVTSRVYADWTGKPAPIEVMRHLHLMMSLLSIRRTIGIESKAIHFHRA